jgi:hypothetical protein
MVEDLVASLAEFRPEIPVKEKGMELEYRGRMESESGGKGLGEGRGCLVGVFGEI